MPPEDPKKKPAEDPFDLAGAEERQADYLADLANGKADRIPDDDDNDDD